MRKVPPFFLPCAPCSPAVVDFLWARHREGWTHNEISCGDLFADYGAARSGAGLGQGQGGKIAAAPRMGYREARQPLGRNVRGVSGVEKQNAGGSGDSRNLWHDR